jgi:pimeloyl-ACP methyl ester carboxylesterase
MNQEIRMCRSADGTRIAYALTGAGSPLVMSAPWLTHLEHQWRSLAWRPWLEALSRERTVLRYDSRGCGLSDRAVSDVSFADVIARVRAVIDPTTAE